MAALPPSAPRVMLICLAVLLVAAADVAPAGAAAQEAPARSLKGFSSFGGRGSSIRSSSMGGYSSSSDGDGGSHGSVIVVEVVIGCLVIVLPLAGGLLYRIASAEDSSGDRPKEDAPQVAQQAALVSLDRSDGAALGVDIREKQDHLLITGIHEEGLASEWNKAHPDAQLRVDDKIVAVNGACGSGDALLAQCKRHAALRISVVPAGAGTSDARPKDTPQVAQQVTLVSLDRSDGAALGVDISEKQDHLLVTRIHEEGLASAWNKAHPDTLLRVDDKIVAVNGACGSGDALLAQCKRHVALRISVVPAGAVLPPQSLGWRDACVGIGNNGYGV